MASSYTNIGHFVSKRALLNPNLEALVDADTGRRFTFGELNDRVNRTAHLLLERGVGRGDRIALMLMNSVEFEESYFAIAKIGAIAVPLNWRLVPDELAFILADSGATTIVFESAFAGAVEELRSRHGETVLETFIQVGDNVRDWACDYNVAHRAASSEEVDIENDIHDLLHIIYTSGTTGTPKGVMHSHFTVLWGILTIDATVDQHFADRYLLALPMFHVGALAGAIGACHAGVTQVVIRTFDASKAWDYIENERITTGLLVPTILNYMLQTRPARIDTSRLRWIMSGASPLPVMLIDAYAGLGIEIHQVYGLTESCGPVCVISPDEALARAGSTGKEFFFTKVRVVDENGVNVPPDTPGELICRGNHIMVGYWNRPEATAAAIIDGWLHTGDVAVVDKDGYISISDRIKDVIISGGENIYPAEIENVILTHPDVAEVAVISRLSERWGETPLAVVVRRNETLTEQDVIAYTDGKLARYKRPAGAVFIDEIPRNPSGKALKHLLRDRFSGSAS